MSVRLRGLIDQVNWVKVKKLYPELSNGSLAVIKAIAWRQGDEPPYAVYISQKEWIETTGYAKSSFYEYLKPAIACDLVTQVIKGSNTNNTRAHYRINEIKLESLPKRDVRYSGQTKKDKSGNSESKVHDSERRGTVERTHLSGMVEAKRQERHITKLNDNSVRFENLIKDSLPSHLAEKITTSPQLESLLDELEANEVSYMTISNKLSSHNWNGLNVAYPQVMKLLRELLTPAHKSEQVPKEPCKTCDGSGKLEHSYEIPHGDGARTQACPECSAKGKAIKREVWLRNQGRENPISDLTNGFGLPDY